MSNLNKVDVPIAVQNKTKLDLSCDHITSTGFMRPSPVFYRHMVKTEHLGLEAMSQVRPAPIEVPVYGQLKQNLRAFFVPYRLVFPQWENFINDVIGSNMSGNSLVYSPPTIPMNELVSMFLDQTLPQPLTSTDPLWTDGDVEVSGSFYNFTPRGRRYLNVLESLGYKIIWNGFKDDDEFYNALALLAYCKVYLDWYTNAQYLNTTEILMLERILSFNDPTSHKALTANEMYWLLELVNRVVYDIDDYYVNAWDNPVSPNSGQFSSFSFADPTSYNGARVATNSLGSPEMYIGTDDAMNVLSSVNPDSYEYVAGALSSIGTSYIHEALKKLTDFQKRHALAGARAIDRVLAQYGIVTDSLKQQRSIYVGNQQVDIEFGSIYATANGSNGVSSSSTGDYAGAAYGKGQKNWDFQSDEDGIFLVIQTIIPNGQMVQGYDRNNRHLGKMDFFQPEFDSLGVQAIEKGEVYVPDNDTFAATGDDYKGAFGFSGRYGEMKRPKSFLTGDFRVLKQFQGYDSWHLFRMFNDANWSNDIANVVHSLSFSRSGDGNQYNRIFQYQQSDVDCFFCFFHFNAASYAPVKPLFETYEFDGGAKKIPTENGNKVN